MTGQFLWQKTTDTVKVTNPDGSYIVPGVVPVEIQDQYSEAIDLYFCQKFLTTSPSSWIALDAKSINLVSVVWITAWNCIDISENGRTFQALVQTVVSSTVTFNCPSDQAFTTNAVVKIGNWNMNVNGAVTPVIYTIQPPAWVKWDINRIIVGMLDDTAMDDSKFWGITALTNWVVFRIKDWYYKNLFVVSDNWWFRERSFDAQYLDKAPAGVYGFWVRKTFNGQDKSGVTLRLDWDTGDQLQIIIQDNLTWLTKFSCVAQWHTVVE